MKIEFDKYSLIIDGKREFIRSGALHYFRSPGEEIWKDRLSKLKAAGYNAVDLYFNWGYHSPEKGEYDFSGIRDVKKLLDITKELGLYVIARPGPYINGEVSAGGFPTWLLNEPDVILRNRVGGDYNYSPKYMEYLKEWYSKIIPIVNRFDNVIMMQVENEYSTNMGEEDYIKELYDYVRSLGVSVPIFHNDAYFAGLYADVVDIYACDLYPYINPDQKWREDHFCFDTLDNIEENIKPCKEDAPLYIAEMQGGWFDKWCGPGYKYIRDQFGRDHINIVTATVASQGVTMFNHYMGCGGTSWGDLACDEVYTSYEFSAPVSEVGIPQENYYKAKEINYLLSSFNLASTDMKMQEDELLVGEYENIYAKLRKDNINDCEWLFIRNLNDKSVDVKLTLGYSIELNPYEMKILPVNLQLKACSIDFSSDQILGKIEKDDYEVVVFILDDTSSLSIDKEALTFDKDKDVAYKLFEKDSKTTQIVLIDQKTADKTWFVEDGIIIGPDFLTDNNNSMAFKNSTIVKYFNIDTKEWIKRSVEVSPESAKPEILNHKLVKASPEVDPGYDYSSWKEVKEKTDCISNKVFDEFIWYKGSYEGAIKEITLKARHCWAVYINGKAVCARDSYCYTNLYEDDETLNFNVPKKLQSDKNEITILVQNIGFDKGFSNDTNVPRGILEFSSVPEKHINWKIRGAGTPEIEKWDQHAITELRDVSDSYSLLWQEFEFKIDQKEDVFEPLKVNIKNDKIEKAALYLNGYKIGRYWYGMSQQKDFYLIDSFLREVNRFSMLIWVKNSKLKHLEDFKYNKNNVIINIGVIESYQLVKTMDMFQKVNS